MPERLIKDSGGNIKFVWPRVSHNGIVVYDNEHQLQLHLPLYDFHHYVLRTHTINDLSTGLFCFKDSLLPEVSVSRSTIKRFTPEIVAHVLYATRELNEFQSAEFGPFSYLPDLEGAQRRSTLLYNVELFDRIQLYQKDSAYWHSIPCVSVKDEGFVTIGSVLELVKTRPVILKTYKFRNAFFTNIVHYILLKKLEVEYTEDETDWQLLCRQPSGEIRVDAALSNFPPLKFMECAGSSKPVLRNGSFNLLHPLIKWFVENANLIEKEYSYFGYQLFNELSDIEGSPARRATAINEILDRLRVLLPLEAKPCIDISITEEQLRMHL